MDQFISRLEIEELPKVKYSSHILDKRKYLSNLIKIRNYKEAETIKNSLKQMEIAEQAKWVEKVAERKQLRIEKV